MFTLFAAALMCVSVNSGFSQVKDSASAKKGYVFTTDKAVPVTSIKNQGSSGTCWDFSTTSFIESEAIKNGSADTTLNLSEMFSAFYNYKEKFEKYVRLDGYLNLAEGGSFEDVIHTMEDYGVVLDEQMPSLRNDAKRIDFGEMSGVLGAYGKAVVKSAGDDGKLSQYWKQGFDAIMESYLGKCPDKVTYKGVEYSPKEFVTKGLKLNMDDYVSITSFTHHPFYSKFAIEVPDNWRWDLSYNVPMNEMMAIIDNAIEEGYSIAWGSDVSEKGFTRNGLGVVPDVEANEKAAGSDQERWIGKDPRDKAKELDLYNQEAPGKEMAITQEMRQKGYDGKTTTDDHGLHIYGIAHDQNGTKYYVVKNSWGKSGKYKGIWYVSVPFVEFKTMNIVVNKNAIPKDIRKKLGL